MILLIPYTKFTLKTQLSAHEAEQYLAVHVEPRKLLRWKLPQNHKFFAGKVENGKFNINRIIHYQTTFLPIIVGQIDNDLETSCIEITMRLNNIFVGLMTLILPLWLSMGYIFFSFSISLESGAKDIVFFVAILIVFYGISMILFNLEVNKARRYLEKIFQVNATDF